MRGWIVSSTIAGAIFPSSKGPMCKSSQIVRGLERDASLFHMATTAKPLAQSLSASQMPGPDGGQKRITAQIISARSHLQG